MFDYMYLRLVYLYDDRKVYLTNEPLWVRFCAWFLLTFFKERLCIDELLKEATFRKRQMKDLERRLQMLKELHLKTSGELAWDEALGTGATDGDIAWLEEDYPRRKRGGV